MQIGWTELLEFRSYRTLFYSPGPRLNVLIGPNGQGKTNLLEALAFLLTGRSFRTSRSAEAIHWEADTAAVTGEIRRADGGRTVRRTIQKLSDGVSQSSGQACSWARTVVFGWQDLGIINGAPAARRNFLDGFAGRLYGGHLATLARFRQILGRRNHLLQSRMTEPVLTSRLAPWDEQLASVGVELMNRRVRAAAALQTEVSRIYPSLAGSGSKVEVRYRAAISEVTKDAFMAALEAARSHERRRGQTLVGPHRDDLAIEIDGVDARAFGSRGQQRLLALALRFAEILPITEAVGTTPVLLLDDALSELDRHGRENVLREIQTAEQVFLTSPEPLSTAAASAWRVDGGEVVPA